MNLPNALTVGRIAVTPLLALLPFVPSPMVRLLAFVLFLIAAVSDLVDGKLARSRQQETDLGRLLDPLADKLLLVGTFIPMYWLGGTGPLLREGHGPYPFVTPFGTVALPWWIVLIVLGREVFMTVFRQVAARRGVVIAAIGPAKWKTGFQLVWQGAAYFWFFFATAVQQHRWDNVASRAFAQFNGIVGMITMTVAVLLTLYSLGLYMRRYGTLFVGRRTAPAGRERQ